MPEKALRSISGTWIWNTGAPLVSVKGREYTGWRRSRAVMKAHSGSLRWPSAGSERSRPSPWMFSSAMKPTAALLARTCRRALIHVRCVISGRSRVKLVAWPRNSSLSMVRVTISRAMRTSCSWFSIKRRRICCCAISVSRLTDSVSRSISSLRRYQKAEMMAARNSSAAQWWI